MSTALLTHSDCFHHVNPPGHPEQVGRLAAVLTALEAEEFCYLVRVDAPLAEDAQILRAHPASYLAELAGRVPNQGYSVIDGDTYLGPATLTAARRGAGAVVRAVDMVLGARCATPSARSGHRGIMPRPPRRWGSASSATP